MGFYRKLHNKFMKERRGKWPMPETDYDGNDLWARAFPKPQPRSPALEWWFKYGSTLPSFMWSSMWGIK